MRKIETKGKDTNQLLSEIKELEKDQQKQREREEMQVRVADRVSLAKEFVRHLKLSVPSDFNDIVLDDYGNYSFSVVMHLPVKHVGGGYYPKDKTKFDLRRITNTIKRVAKTFGDIKYLTITHPERKYSSDYGQKSFDGYERSYTQIEFEIHS